MESSSDRLFRRLLLLCLITALNYQSTTSFSQLNGQSSQELAPTIIQVNDVTYMPSRKTLYYQTQHTEKFQCNDEKIVLKQVA